MIFKSPSKLQKMVRTSGSDDITTPIVSKDSSIKNENLNLAIKYTVFSMLTFVLVTIHQKIISPSMNFNKMLMFNLFRLLGICLTALFYLLYTKEHELKPLFLSNLTTEKQKELKWMIARSFFLSIGTVFFMYGLMNVKQMNLMILVNIFPLIQTLLAPYFINQKFKYQYLIVTLIAFVGIVIMVVGGDEVLEPLESKDSEVYVKNKLLGTISSILFAFTFTIISFSLVTLNKEYDSYNLNYLSSFWGLIIGIILIVLFKGLFFLYEYFTVFLCFNGMINGVLLCSSYVFQYHSYLHAEVQKITYIYYAEIPILTIFAFIFYGETINILEILGASVLLGTIYYTSKYLK